MTKFYKKFFDTIKQQLENSELDQLNNISEKLKKIKKAIKQLLLETAVVQLWQVMFQSI